MQDIHCSKISVQTPHFPSLYSPCEILCEHLKSDWSCVMCFLSVVSLEFPWKPTPPLTPHWLNQAAGWKTHSPSPKQTRIHGWMAFVLHIGFTAGLAGCSSRVGQLGELCSQHDVSTEFRWWVEVGMGRGWGWGVHQPSSHLPTWRRSLRAAEPQPASRGTVQPLAVTCRRRETPVPAFLLSGG